MKSWGLIPMLVVVAATVISFGHHSAAAKPSCRSPTAEDARYLAKTCSNVAVGPIFECCGASRSFIFSCSNCEAADRRSGVQTPEAKRVVRLLDNAAKACNFNLSKVVIQELDCLGVKDWYETPLESDLRR